MKNKFLKSLYFFVCISFFVYLNFLYCGATEKISDNDKYVLIVTGTNLLDKEYDKENLLGIQNEVGYTLDDLKNLEESCCFFSALNSYKTKSIYLSKGIKLSTLLHGKQDSNVTVFADDGYSKQVDMLVERYYYPNISNDNCDNKLLVNNMLIWEKCGQKGTTDIPNKDDLKACNLKLMIGQKSIDDMNNSKFVSNVTTIVLGEKVPSILKVNDRQYRRSELMLLGNIKRTFTYNTQVKKKTVYVRGIELKELLKDYDDNFLVKFKCVDEYETKELSIKELIANNYMLAYEKGKSVDTIEPIYDSCIIDDKVKGGYLTLYGDNKRPVKMICEIKIHKKIENNDVDDNIDNKNINMSRIKFLSVLAYLDNTYSTINNYNCQFEDLTETDKSVVGWAYENKLINGYSTLKFMPNKQITREQANVILNRYIAYKLKKTSTNLQVIQFLNTIEFNPKDKITKYDAVKSLLKVIKYLENEGLYEGN